MVYFILIACVLVTKLVFNCMSYLGFSHFFIYVYVSGIVIVGRFNWAKMLNF